MKPWRPLAAAALAALAAGFWLGRQAALPAPALQPPAAAPRADKAQPAASAPGTIADDGFSGEFVKTAPAAARPVPDELPVTGKLSLDRRQLRIAAARVAGRLGRIFVFEGQAVRAGEPLAEIYSPDFISAENEFLLARRYRDTLAADADAELRRDSQATYESAQSRLRVLGAADQDIRQLAASGAVAQYLAVRAPVGGVVMQRNVDPGGYLNIGDALMTIARPDPLWLTVNVYAPDYARIRLGQPLRFETDALPGRTFAGTLSFIAPTLDPATHTLALRCDVPNPGGLLRPEMFVSGRLQVGTRPALVVPAAAVFRVREQAYVFVRDGAARFRRLAVQGQPVDGGFAVTGGLSADQPVVTEGTLLLNQKLSGG
ncbi:MAG: efflux RND transporter periplasmic adaptor subunit [Nevskia sp.]|nr:efflux RND transporter periplasmic adaptor subunit [Nevskia sp.]